jgi:hypothetical protein
MYISDHMLEKPSVPIREMEERGPIAREGLFLAPLSPFTDPEEDPETPPATMQTEL